MKRRTVQACLLGLCMAVSVPGNAYAAESGSEIVCQSAEEENLQENETGEQNETVKEDTAADVPEKEETEQTENSKAESPEKAEETAENEEKDERSDLPEEEKQPVSEEKEKQEETAKEEANPAADEAETNDDAGIVSGLSEEAEEEAVQPAHELSVSVEKALDETATYIQQDEKNSSRGKEWYVFGLTRNGVKKDSSFVQNYYTNMVQYLTEHKGKLSEDADCAEYAALILTMTAMGKDARSIVGYNLFASMANFEAVKKQGLRCAAWTLLAVNSHDTYDIPQINSAEARTTKQRLTEYILEKESSQGGWPAKAEDDTADPEMTGLVLQALAPYYQKDGYEKVTQAIERAFVRLSEEQQEDGGYKNAQATAQVLAGLCTLGIDPAEDERFIKNGNWLAEYLMAYYVPGGGFAAEMQDGNHGKLKHTVNQETTETVYCALTAYQRLKEKTSSLYDMKDLQLTKGEAVKDPENPSEKEDNGEKKPDTEEKKDTLSKDETKKEEDKKETAPQEKKDDKTTKNEKTDKKLKLVAKTGKKLKLSGKSGKKLTLSGKTKKLTLSGGNSAKKLALSGSSAKKMTLAEGEPDEEQAESQVDELSMESGEALDTGTETSGKKLTLSGMPAETAASEESEAPEATVTEEDGAQNQMEAREDTTETESVEAKQHTTAQTVAVIVVGMLLIAGGIWVYLKKKKR